MIICQVAFQFPDMFVKILYHLFSLNVALMSLEQIHGNKNKYYAEKGTFLQTQKFVLGLQKVCNAICGIYGCFSKYSAC
jgi:hypothetical protein